MVITRGLRPMAWRTPAMRSTAGTLEATVIRMRWAVAETFDGARATRNTGFAARIRTASCACDERPWASVATSRIRWVPGGRAGAVSSAPVPMRRRLANHFR